MEQNYWKLNDLSVFTVPFAYVDHESYIADPIFNQKEISVSFLDEMGRNDLPYHIIHCRVAKKDAEKFKEAMEELKKRILILGHTDYSDVCAEITNILQSETKPKRSPK